MVKSLTIEAQTKRGIQGIKKWAKLITSRKVKVKSIATDELYAVEFLPLDKQLKACFINPTEKELLQWQALFKQGLNNQGLKESDYNVKVVA